MNSKQQSKTVKILVIGDSGVGKSSLIFRQVENQFLPLVNSIGIDFRSKIYEFNSIAAKVQLWDTVGAQRFKTLSKPFYRNSSAVCLCFSLCNNQSLQNLARWIGEIKSIEVKPTPLLYVIGCKSDEELQIPSQKIKDFMETHQLVYMETSAKTSVGVNLAFRKIVEETFRFKFTEEAKELNKKETLEEKLEKKQGCW